MHAGVYDTTRGSAYLESSRHELRQITHFICYLILERSFECLGFIGFNAVATQYGTWITRVHPLSAGTCRSSPLTRQLEEPSERRRYITKYYEFIPHNTNCYSLKYLPTSSI
ncbi:hypothetical protein P5V15_008657 [Pogonomyrmex californicus]